MLAIVMDTETGCPTRGSAVSTLVSTLMSLSEHSTTSVEVGEGLALTSVADGDGDAEVGDPLGLGDAEAVGAGAAGAAVESGSPPDGHNTMTAINTNNTAPTTTARRRQYTVGGSGPIGFMRLSTLPG
jgi:hypothetical protein